MTDGERLARQFHQLYEAMAPGFGYETRTETREFDPESNNGKLMIAVCSVIQGMLTARLAEAEKERDWLCNCMARIAGHSEFSLGASRGLLAGLLASIKRITNEAAKGGRDEH